MLIPPEEARDVQEPTSLRLLIFLLIYHLIGSIKNKISKLDQYHLQIDH